MSDQQAAPATRSADIGELAKALAQAQGEYDKATKDSVNPHFKASYADLASVTNACRPALTKHGIAVIQRLSSKQASVTVSTMLVHSSGQWISDELTVPVSKADAQGFVAACTYARRASLSAMTGIAPEDDDGNEASGHATPQSAYNQARQQAAERKPEKRDVASATDEEIKRGLEAAAPMAGEYRSGTIWQFGRLKGKDLAEFTSKELSSSFDYLLAQSADPSRAKFKEKSDELAAKVMDEIERREVKK